MGLRLLLLLVVMLARLAATAAFFGIFSFVYVCILRLIALFYPSFINIVCNDCVIRIDL